MVVAGERVGGGLHVHVVPQHTRARGAVRKGHRESAGGHLPALPGDHRAVPPQDDVRVRRGGRPEDDAHVKPLSRADGARSHHAVHQHLGTVLAGDRHGVDGHPRRGRHPGGGDGVPLGRLPIAQDHEPARSVCAQDAEAQVDGRGDVGGVGIRHGPWVGPHLPGREGSDEDGRPPETDDPHAVSGAPAQGRLAQDGLLELPSHRGDAERPVHEEQDAGPRRGQAQDRPRER